MKAQCINCGTPIEFQNLPEPQILNRPDVSCVVVQHPRTAYCLGCKSPVALSVENAGLGLVARPVNVQQKSPIVIAPASALPKGKG